MSHPPYYKRIAFWVILLLVVGTAGVTAQALPLGRMARTPNNATIPTGYDPLSPTERTHAQNIFSNDPRTVAALDTVQRLAWLRTERHEETKETYALGQWDRRADVYLYLYDTDTLLYGRVNLETAAVDAFNAQLDQQLPPTDEERLTAQTIFRNDPAAQTKLREMWPTTTKNPAVNDAKLYTATILHPDANTPPNNPIATCAQHRCAQFFVVTNDEQLLNILPVINLSTEQIVAIDYQGAK